MFEYPILFVITELVNLLLGPVLFLYYKQIFELKITKKPLLHFIVPCLYFIYFLIHQVVVLSPLSASNYLKIPVHATLVFITTCSLFSYTYFIYIHIRKYRGKFKNLKLNIDIWLYLLPSALLLKGLAGLVILSKKLFFNSLTLSFNPYYQFFFILIETLLLLAVGYFGLKEANTFRLERLAATGEEKNKKLLVTQEEANIYLEKLSNAMEEGRIFTNSELDEKLLAKNIGIQPYQLSILLNKYVGKTFAEFINHYRIEEAKRMLLDKKKSTEKMFSIAIDCGFNSESVFYTNFKKYTGTTPRQFQKEFING